jgi:3-oxoacyl-[acyl-carrier-protein] synthase III
LILITPAAIDQLLEAKLKKVDIDLIVYEWQKEQAVFPGLPALIY